MGRHEVLLFVTEPRPNDRAMDAIIRKLSAGLAAAKAVQLRVLDIQQQQSETNAKEKA